MYINLVMHHVPTHLHLAVLDFTVELGYNKLGYNENLFITNMLVGPISI